MTQRHLASGLAGLPEAQEPDVIEALTSHLVEKGIGNICQRRGPSQTVRKLPEPHPGVDLIKRMLTHHERFLLLNYRMSAALI